MCTQHSVGSCFFFLPGNHLRHTKLLKALNYSSFYSTDSEGPTGTLSIRLQALYRVRLGYALHNYALQISPVWSDQMDFTSSSWAIHNDHIVLNAGVICSSRLVLYFTLPRKVSQLRQTSDPVFSLTQHRAKVTRSRNSSSSSLAIRKER